MIKEQAIVVSVQGKHAEIQMMRQNACSHCDFSQGCGTGAIGRMLGHRNKPLLVENTLKLQVGDHILLGMPDESFLTASLLIYGLPLGLLIVSAALSQMLFNGSEILVAIAAGGGFLAGLYFSAKLAGKTFTAQFKPRILQINSEPTQEF